MTYVKRGRGRPKVKRTVVRCLGCDARLVKRATDVARSRTGRFFCSKPCQDKVGSKPRRGGERTCERCPTTFYAGPNSTQRFCSQACQNEDQRKDRVERVCELCGITFWLRPSHAAHNAGRFCSRECASVQTRKRPLEWSHNGKPALLDNTGHVRVWEPTTARRSMGGWVLYHRLLMEQHLGRPLRTNEQVHHINHIPYDNRLENLVILSAAEHTRLHNAHRLAEIADLRQELAAYRSVYGPIELVGV